ncbi:MAG: hypothetical protein JSV43_06800 [Methanobacteriota archaeon]|nr:MAG: hypothetical protein JSV43_06800 [Euryarchaeota archaeon]
MAEEGLTVNEKILLHLKECRSSKENLSPGATQEGIAQGVDIRRSHVPRAVKKLVSDGSVEEIKGRLPGRARKMKMYVLTESGMRIAKDISDEIEKQTVIIRGVEQTEMTLRDARLVFEMTTLEILRNMSPEGILEIPEEMEEEEMEFLNRKEELAEMGEWINQDTAILVIYSPEGFGKTQLARRFLKTLKKFDVCWRELAEDDSTFELYQTISDFLARRGRKRALELFQDGEIDSLLSTLPDEMASVPSVYVFDNYFHVGEDIVDLLSHLAKNSRRLKDSRILILAREATPSYCRFYTKDSVERKLVREMHMKGLDEKNSWLLLGRPHIDEESFRRVYLLTKGCPLYLRLIRDGEAEELKRRSRFTNPEIKLLMFSKDVKAK